jgi:hypothetical protein
MREDIIMVVPTGLRDIIKAMTIKAIEETGTTGTTAIKAITTTGEAIIGIIRGIRVLRPTITVQGHNRGPGYLAANISGF